jgi:glyoxylase-like metal-dependent hydrolase (beta-lactamase superfamily II)
MTSEHIVPVYERLFQIRLPLPIRPNGVQVYLFENGDRSVLIDTGLGTEESLEVLHDSLKQIGRSLSDIRVTVCTHYHPDHYGAAEKIKQLSGCEVLMHKADFDYLFSNLLLNPGDYRTFLLSHGLPVNGTALMPPTIRVLREHYHPVAPDKYLADGEELDFGDFNLKVIWTPGHSPGHVVLYWPDPKLLISGDHLLPTITPHVGIHTGLEGNPLANYLDSLNQLEKLDISQVLPAHGRSFSDHRKRIVETFHHHEERQLALLDRLAAGPATAYELALSLFDQSLPDLHKEIAAFEVLAHLEFMKTINKVRVQSDNSVIRFSL